MTDMTRKTFIAHMRGMLPDLEAAYIEAVRALESCADPDNWTRHKDARPPAEADWGRCARDTLEKINADT